MTGITILEARQNLSFDVEKYNTLLHETEVKEERCYGAKERKSKAKEESQREAEERKGEAEAKEVFKEEGYEKQVKMRKEVRMMYSRVDWLGVMLDNTYF